jgi:hypothetical protein
VIWVTGWEELDKISVPTHCSFLNLGGFDSAFWENITPDYFKKFKTLLSISVNVLWVTWGSNRDNGNAAMTLGFFCSLSYELPEAQLQVLNLEGLTPSPASFIAERLLHLEVIVKWPKTQPADSNKMWTIEPEYMVQKGYILIPRVVLENAQNDWYNSAKHRIMKDVKLNSAIMTLNQSNSGYSLREEESQSLPSIPGYRQVHIDLLILSLLAMPAGRLFVSLRTDIDSADRILSVSPKNASIILISEQWSIPVDVRRSINVQYLSFLLGYLSSHNVATLIPCGGTLVVYEPDPGLASMLSHHLSSQGSQVVFTTSNPQLVKRNWQLVHLRIPDC